MTRTSLRVADAIATVSRFSQGELAEAYGVPADRIHVVPNGVAEEFFLPPAGIEEATRRLHLPDRFLLAVGAHEVRKGLLTLLEAMTLLPAGAEPLVLAGGRGGGRRLNAVEEARRTGVEERVRVLGWVADEDLRILYRCASAVLCLSEYEGFGLPALEALAAGAPLIVAAGSALPEVVGEAAWSVEPRSAAAVARVLAALRDDPARAARMRAAGPVRAREFSWGNAARAYLRLYGFA